MKQWYLFIKDKRSLSKLVSIALLLSAVLILFFFQENARALSSSNSSVINLTVKDQTELSSPLGGSRFTNGTIYSKTMANWNTYVYVNFTNLSSKAAITDGNCTVRFQENQTSTYNSLGNMSYNATLDAYVFNRSFIYKGNITYQSHCEYALNSSSDYRRNATENITISNTAPFINGKDPGLNLPTQSITEDTNFTYNLSFNATEDDLNDWSVLSFNNVTGNTTLTNFTISSGGILDVNVSVDNDVGGGSKNLVWQVVDSSGSSDTAILPFTITKVNDAPRFGNLNSTMNATEDINFNITVNATDEEGNTPFTFTRSFVSCEKASWTNSSNCTIFNINSSTGAINFTSSNDDVGNYTINFTVQDNNSITAPYNASRNFTVTFTVINTNDAPNITFLCDNTRSSTEDTIISCIINATDADENSNITFISNTTWFTFNNSRNSFTSNLSNDTGQNITGKANVSFTANDSSVGVSYINISANDSLGGIYSRVITFNVSNVNDSVALQSFNASYNISAGAEFFLDINATDDDLRIPANGKSCSTWCYNESITITRNITGRNLTLFNLVSNGTLVNASLAYFRFVPSDNDSGIYDINITARDANNFSISSKVFTINITNNSAPNWINLTASIFTFNEGAFTMNLSLNATDTDNDAITFSDNTSLFDITSSGFISISASTSNDSNVGSHNLSIILTDSKGAQNQSQTFRFTIKNVNETPVLYAIPTPQNATEDTLFTLNFSGFDEDLSLNTSASDYYPENLAWSRNSTTSWFTSGKLNFTRLSNTTASISFTPNRTDVAGPHVINITINDSTTLKDSQEFNLSVSGVEHSPLFDYTGSPVNISLNSSNNYTCTECFDINVSDVEDGYDNVTGNNNFSLASNESWFSIGARKGKVNFTVNTSHIKANGSFINISLNDSANFTNSTVFRITIFEYNQAPTIQVLTPSDNTNLDENTSKNFQVIVNDENANLPNNDTLTLVWKIDNVTNVTQTFVTNNSLKTFNYSTNFTDETTNSTAHNISVHVTDSAGNITVYSWNASVNHSNANVVLSANITNVTASATSSATLTCNLGTAICEIGSTSFSVTGTFSDLDHSDTRYNQSINFTFRRYDENCSATSSTINLAVNNDTLDAVFTTSTTKKECFSITAIDLVNSTFNVTSNNFTVNLTVTAPATVSVPSGGGGGGGSERKKPIALKIIVPEPVTLFTIDRIIVPIGIQNIGEIDLFEINISTFSTLKGVRTELSKSYFSSLLVGSRENLDMTIITDTNETGTYEIILTANSTTPKYSDSASFFVNLVEIGFKDKVKAQEKIVFLEELLLGNPECLELKEILNEAKKEFEKKNFARSLELSESAIQACKYAVTSKGRTLQLSRRVPLDTIVIGFFIALVLITAIFSVYYYLSRKRLKKSRF